MRTHASAACSSPEYQSCVSITSATAMPRSTVKVWNGLPAGVFSDGAGSVAIRVSGGNADATRRSTKFHAGLGRGGATACRKPGTRLMRWGSGRAHGGAARAALAIELQSIAQRPLAPGAARVAQLEMVRPAGAGGLLLGVAGAAVPNTFSEGHSGPLP